MRILLSHASSLSPTTVAGRLHIAAQLPVVTSQLRFEALSSSLNLNMTYGRQWKWSLEMATSS